MDISQAVSLSEFLIPLAASWTIFRIARRIQIRWLRLSVRTLSSVFVGVSVVLVVFISLFSVACTSYGPSIYSPDGRHLAAATYLHQGAFGDDYATVSVRPRWRPWATDVYFGVGSWRFREGKPSDPEVRWLDSTHLLIRHTDDRTGKEGLGGPPTCRSKAGTIQVVCELVRTTPSERVNAVTGK